MDRVCPSYVSGYFRSRFDPLERFLSAAFLAVLVDFFGDFRAGLTAVFAADDDRLPEKMFSQLSEYFFVAPMRTTLMAEIAPNGMLVWMNRSGNAAGW